MCGSALASAAGKPSELELGGLPLRLGRGPIDLGGAPMAEGFGTMPGHVADRPVRRLLMALRRLQVRPRGTLVGERRAFVRIAGTLVRLPRLRAGDPDVGRSDRTLSGEFGPPLLQLLGALTCPAARLI